MPRSRQRLARSLDIEEEPELKITALIDTVFLLLIFFIVTADTPSEEKTLELNLIRSAPAARQAGRAEVMVVKVNADCQVLVKGRTLTLPEFRRAMQKELAAHPGRFGVAVDASGQARTGCIVKILDVCAQLGVRDFGLAHTPEPPAPEKGPRPR